MTDAACITAEGLNLPSALVHSKHEMKLGPNVELTVHIFILLCYFTSSGISLTSPALCCERATTYTESVFLDGHSSAPTTTAVFYKVMQFIHPCSRPIGVAADRHTARHTPTLTRKHTDRPLRPWNPVECRVSHKAREGRTAVDRPCSSVTD